MFKNYSNQNHAVHRSENPLEKVASIYDKQGISNRESESAPLSFSTLAPSEAEVIIGTISKEAQGLNELELEKKASPLSSPFNAFGDTRTYISSKFGLADDVAHDLASSVIAKAQDLQDLHGGELGEMISGIVDNMDANAIKAKIGVSPMRSKSVVEVEDTVKQLLIDAMQLSSYKADQLKKTVVQQARNLQTSYRTKTLEEIAIAVTNVLIEHQDVSIAYSISTSDRLKSEVKYHLTNV